MKNQQDLPKRAGIGLTEYSGRPWPTKM